MDRPVKEARGQRPDWRDGAAYERLVRIDRSGLMWEWLRRDSGYVAWYTRASRATRAGSGVR